MSDEAENFRAEARGRRPVGEQWPACGEPASDARHQEQWPAGKGKGPAARWWARRCHRGARALTWYWPRAGTTRALDCAGGKWKGWGQRNRAATTRRKHELDLGSEIGVAAMSDHECTCPTAHLMPRQLAALFTTAWKSTRTCRSAATSADAGTEAGRLAGAGAA